MTEKAKKLSEELYSLELFEEMELTRISRIMRVPNGWVLIDIVLFTSTFIPFDNEFDIIK